MKLSELFEDVEHISDKVKAEASHLLGVDNLVTISKNDFDDSKLDAAKEEGTKRISSAAGNWILRLFKSAKDAFVQVQSPDRKVMYFTAMQTEQLVTEGLWIKTNKYRLSKDPKKDSKNGEDYLNIPGVPGGVAKLEKLDQLLRASDGKVTDEVLAWKGDPQVMSWLRWVKDNNRTVKHQHVNADGEKEYLNY